MSDRDVTSSTLCGSWWAKKDIATSDRAFAVVRDIDLEKECNERHAENLERYGGSHNRTILPAKSPRYVVQLQVPALQEPRGLRS